MIDSNHPTVFAPHLAMKDVQAGVSFYQKAFAAKVERTWANDSGGLHVAELTIGGALLHLHEEGPLNQQLSPETVRAVTSLIGMFVPDPHSTVASAVAAGARVLNPVQDYDYGYQQGTVADPFGHQWLIQKKI